MNYKGILLSALLIPFAITSNNNTDAQIQDLKKKLYEKELDISKMGEEIERVEELIESLTLKFQTIYTNICESLNEQEEEELKSEISSFLERIDKVIINCEIKDFFIKEFFNNKKNNNELARIKSLIVRAFVEKQILRKIIMCYEELFQEASEINRTLGQLQK